MSENTNTHPAASELPPEVIDFAGKMYNAARAGQIDVFQQALPAGLPANLTNEKGDTLVGSFSSPLQTVLRHSIPACSTLLFWGRRWNCGLYHVEQYNPVPGLITPRGIGAN